MKNLLLASIIIFAAAANVYSQKKLIAFSSDATKNDKQQIFIMDEEGDNVKQVAFLDLDCYNPRFAPNSTKIVFCATNVISDYLYTIDLADISTFRFPMFLDGGIDPVFFEDGTMLM